MEEAIVPRMAWTLFPPFGIQDHHREIALN